MEEQIIKILCKLIEFMGKTDYCFSNSEEFVDRFLQEAELCLSPDGKKQLIKSVREVNKFFVEEF